MKPKPQPLKTKEFKVLGPDGDHEYNIVVEEYAKDDIKFSLYASHNPIWSQHTRGILMLSLHDDGDAATLNKGIKKIEYDVLLELRILLNFEKYYSTVGDHIDNTYRIVEQTLLFES